MLSLRISFSRFLQQQSMIPAVCAASINRYRDDAVSPHLDHPSIETLFYLYTDQIAVSESSVFSDDMMGFTFECDDGDDGDDDDDSRAPIFLAR